MRIKDEPRRGLGDESNLVRSMSECRALHVLKGHNTEEVPAPRRRGSILRVFSDKV
jgi:hypothetical protein